ncbi:response regulator transcription factor [Trinickia soli]|uniref:DNA-binding response regulator n=1 Tax=Trinickia soli TaxID=380675 RepID=A0A2N7WG45_9BURK|nr:response regulator transcription factor [Trinickia soli]PMS28439.1 DNA-binding response regulator [Trinickia soli]CAB3670041.1 Sensory transduction protein regX3 [Trinickia soli]
MKIAYLEDDETLAEHIGGTLTSNGHECEVFRDGSQLIRRLKRDRFDLLLLDWSMPGVTGHQVTIWARANLSERVPILFMTSRSLETDIVTALSSGADDYMIKPIGVAELLARIDALGRRAYPDAANAQAIIEVGRYRIDPIGRTCFLRNTPIELTGREFDLVLLLFQHVGRVLSREYIGGTLWGQPQNAISRTLDTHMSRVRSKLQLKPDHGVKLMPVYGHGYRLEVVSEAAIDSQPENEPRMQQA